MFIHARLLAVAVLFFFTSSTAYADWQGPYAGLAGKALNGHQPSLNGNVADLSFQTIVGSAFVGYGHQIGNVVFGLELGLDRGGEGEHEDLYYNFGYDTGYYGAMRMGYDAGRYLPYAKISTLRLLYDFSVDLPYLSSLNASDHLTGIGYAIGTDIQIRDNIFGRIEIERRVYHSENLDFGGGLEVSFDGQVMDVLSIGIGLNF